MANIIEKKICNKLYYYLQGSRRDNGGARRRHIYLGTEPPWPKTQGWIKLTSRQIQTINRILERKKVINLPKPAPPTGQYRTLTIDPPWPVVWRPRFSRPNQLGLPYKTMTIDEIKALPIKSLMAPDGCHVYLWTTHHLLPLAFQVFEAWGVTYKCLLTWVKNVGFTPYSFMFTTEPCLFGQVGKLQMLKIGKRLDFSANAKEHSRKPDKFYKLVRTVSPEPRLDMFSREPHKGFEQWGNEPDHFEIQSNG